MMHTSYARLFVGALGIATVLTSSNIVFAQNLDIPLLIGPIPDTQDSHSFLSSEHLQEPINLEDFGYVEEEYFVSGVAGVYEWPGADGLRPLATGPYVTRILIRRPVDDAEFSGIAIVEAMNPSTPVDLPIMWGSSHLQFMADGVAWIGLTVKPNTIKALQRFDPKRYAALGMPHPPGGPECGQEGINPNSQPATTTIYDETGLIWDILSQVGIMLKNESEANPLTRPAQWLYMTGQSQTAAYSRTYATMFSLLVMEKLGEPLYDGFLYSGSPGWQVPLHQCISSLPEGDERRRTGPAGVPVIEFYAQGDGRSNSFIRRADSDAVPDLYRRYEVAGAAHSEPYAAKSFANDQDYVRAAGVPAQPLECFHFPVVFRTEPFEYCNAGMDDVGPAAGDPVQPFKCLPAEVEDSDFPIHYQFNAGWRNLHAWVTNGRLAPKAESLSLKPEAAGDFNPENAFVADEHGNALGGIRSPHVEVPLTRWVGSKVNENNFRCGFYGYKFPFDDGKLASLYEDQEGYVNQVIESVNRLLSQRWLSAEDGAEIVRLAREVRIP